jgi:hypothetical protein
MKNFVLATAMISTLLLAPSCSTSPKAEEKSTATAVTKEDESHSTGHGEAPKPTPSNSHGGHGDHTETPKTSSVTQAKLTAPPNIKSNTAVPLVIDIQDLDGKPINKFEIFQEKLMHLLVVSDDLQVFRHLHPNYQENGRFEVEVNFPQPGSYTLFSDYKPTGGAEEVSVLKTQVAGKSPSAGAIDLSQTKTFDNTKVNLSFSQPTLKTGEQAHLVFNLQNSTDNQPIKDLQPYLGEKGHLVIIKQSSPLTRSDYIHVHALEDTPEGQVHFITNFPQAGKYKLWGQFDRNGKIVTADFWVNVQ